MDGYTTSSVIDVMIKFIREQFLMEPIITNYTCDTSVIPTRCGKASINPKYHTTDLIPYRESPPRGSPPREPETFNVTVEYNKSGNKIYRCPHCMVVTGELAPRNPSDFSLFSHNFDCINENKIPIEPR